MQFEVATLRNYVCELKSMLRMMLDPNQTVNKNDINLQMNDFLDDGVSSSPHGKFAGKVSVTRSVVSPNSPGKQSASSIRRRTTTGAHK